MADIERLTTAVMALVAAVERIAPAQTVGFPYLPKVLDFEPRFTTPVPITTRY